MSNNKENAEHLQNPEFFDNLLIFRINPKKLEIVGNPATHSHQNNPNNHVNRDS